MKTGSKIGGAARLALCWPKLVIDNSRIIPKFPGPEIIEPAVLPKPPLLRSEDKEPNKALKLAIAYRNAVITYYGFCWTFKAETVETIIESKFYPTLVEAIELMENNKIPPAAWVAFSIECWRKWAISAQGRSWNTVPSQMRRPKASQPPPPRWVFSKTRLKERVGYFGWEEQRFRGGRSYIPKEHKLLMRQYTAMKHQILTSVVKTGKISESKLRAIVNEFLPRSRYDKLVEEAQSKVMVKQYEWDKAAKRGEFLW